MKNNYTYLLIVLAIATGYTSSAQYTDVLNNGINFEFTNEYNHYFNASSEVGDSEPVIRTDVWTSNYGWIGEQCHTWSCEPDCYNGTADWQWWAGSAGFTDTWQVWMLSYESDNSDHCTWYSDDDDDWQGSGTLRDNQTIQPIIYPSSNFRPCQIINSLGNGGSGWLFPNNPHFNQILQLKWRYQAGNESTSPLDFGTIGNGQSSSDINSNRSVNNVGNWVDLDYTNTSGESSADVWYKFTVNQPSQVTISTDHSVTDFDTHLALYTVSGNFVADDDDGGSGTTSVISRALCSGTYLINAEGYSSNTGIFKISVSANNAGSPSIASVNSYGVSCPGETDGSADWSGTGGVSPYTYQWNGNSTNTSESGLAQGNYNLVITDACGSTGSETVSIDVADVTPPIAQCQSLVEITVSQGNTTTLDAIEVDNGSTDNCGFITYSVAPSAFSIGNAGANTVTLTVTDESGNSSTCTSSVYALNNTGIEEDRLANRMNLFPNPSDGSFQLNLSGVDLQRNAFIHIIDALGRTVYTSPVTRNTFQIDLQEAEPGMYLVSLNNDGIVASKRIAIQ